MWDSVPSVPSVYRGTVGQTASSGKVGDLQSDPDIEEVAPSESLGEALSVGSTV